MGLDITHYWVEDKLEPRDGYMVVGDDGTLGPITDQVDIANFPQLANSVKPRSGDILRVLIVGNKGEVDGSR